MYMTVKTVLSFGRSVHHDSSFVLLRRWTCVYSGFKHVSYSTGCLASLLICWRIFFYSLLMIGKANSHLFNLCTNFCLSREDR